MHRLLTPLCGVATCLALLASSAPAQAQRLDPELKSTGDLLALCGPAPGTPRMNQRLSYCEGFIAGTGLLYQELKETGVIRPWACAEPIPTAEIIREQFVSWARANPAKLDTKPVDGFWQAMAEAYPCPATPPAKTVAPPTTPRKKP